MSPEKSVIGRRTFLAVAAGAAAAAVGCQGAGETKTDAASPAPTATGEAAAKPRQIPVALELYSVRDKCAKDLPGVLAAISKMGYQGVEFAGYHGKSAAELRQMLDANGLVCCGTHTGLDTLLVDQLPATIEFNHTIGNKFLIVPSLPQERMASPDAWKQTAELFNVIAEKARPAGMRVGYHNHSVEFTPVDGKTPWDIFWDAASPDVVMQVDTGNAFHGGADPLELIRKHPGRTATTHVKEFSRSNPMALIGDGEMKWKEFLELTRGPGKTEWYIIEYESDPAQPLESVAKCLDNLKKLMA